MFIKLKRSLFIPIWLIPVILLYGYKVLNSNFYSLGNFILAVLFSVIIICGDSLISMSIYKGIQDDVTSETSPSDRRTNAGFKMHILTLFLLVLVYFSLMPDIQFGE
ncbi:hypothetical protein A7M79_00645 [Acinetobacter baumannii]|uniref:hypothetical protein n=1 Tax=Acinetobacter baumannii TaxID=470 RepID=UPI0008DCB8E0|nr:hypothetical protein [Acinetobacter baumannii]OIH12031.1 hypothetical protein A7M79_00645 [Acinetobacter baumannii]